MMDGFGASFIGVLTLIFITLKLTSMIDWSWWWVLAPVWGPLAFGMITVALFMAIFHE